MTIKKLECTVRFGAQQVPLYRATWRKAPDQSYPKTFEMKPGNCWFDMERAEGMSEGFALDDSERAVPVDVMVARHLMNEGARAAFFIELWGGNIVAVNENLVCEDWEKCAAGPIIREYITQSGKPGAGGFPDVVAVFPDDRIAFREIKQKGRDSIQSNQNTAADVLRNIYGARADLAIVEWMPR